MIREQGFKETYNLGDRMGFPGGRAKQVIGAIIIRWLLLMAAVVVSWRGIRW